MAAFDFPSSPTLNQVYTANGVTYICAAINPSVWKKFGSDISTGTTKVAVVRDRKNQNVGGGWTDKVVSGANASWNDRDLTVKDDPSNFVTLYPTANGQTTASRGKTPGYFSLPAGTYKIRFKTGGMRVGEHVAALVWSKTQSDISSAYNYTTNPATGFNGGYFFGTTATAIGNLETGSYPTYNLSYSTGSKVVTISETHYFKVIHYNDSNPGYSWAWGSPINTGSSVDENNYTIVEIEDLATAVKNGSGGSGGSGSGNYESYILSLSGNDEIEFTNIPSWATKITLLGENVLLPEPSGGTGNKIGEILEFGGNSGYLNYPAYMNLTSFITRDTANTGSSAGISEYDNSPYAPYILLNASSVGSGPILSQVFFTFVKVKGQNKWVYEGSVANRKGNPSNNNEDLKFLNEFSGSFTATEAITKLKFYSYEGTTPSFTYGHNFSGGTLTAIYEGEGGGSSGSADKPCAQLYEVDNFDFETNKNSSPIPFVHQHISQGGMTVNTSKSRITVPTTGVYLVNAMVAAENLPGDNASDGVVFGLMRNGTVYPESTQETGASNPMKKSHAYPINTTGYSSSVETFWSFSIYVSLNANDYLELAFADIDYDYGDDKIVRGSFGVHLI